MQKMGCISITTSDPGRHLVCALPEQGIGCRYLVYGYRYLVYRYRYLMFGVPEDTNSLKPIVFGLHLRRAVGLYAVILCTRDGFWICASRYATAHVITVPQCTRNNGNPNREKTSPRLLFQNDLEMMFAGCILLYIYGEVSGSWRGKSRWQPE